MMDSGVVGWMTVSVGGRSGCPRVVLNPGTQSPFFHTTTPESIMTLDKTRSARFPRERGCPLTGRFRSSRLLSTPPDPRRLPISQKLVGMGRPPGMCFRTTVEV